METKHLVNLLSEKLDNFSNNTEVKETGKVVSIENSLCYVYGLSNIMIGELVSFNDNYKGYCFSIDEDVVKILLLCDSSNISVGDLVFRTHKKIQIPVGKALIGRVIDVFGNPVDGKGDIQADDYREINTDIPNFVERNNVKSIIETGLIAFDVLNPVLKGHTKTIIGTDDKVNTTILTDILLSQKEFNEKLGVDNAKIFNIFVIIGKKRAEISQLINKFTDMGIMEYSCIVCASGANIPLIKYLAPFSAVAIAQYFRDNSEHCVVYLDNLSFHAVAYKEISLLLNRTPGKESFPVDLSHVYANLFQQAAQLSQEKGGGSLTLIASVNVDNSDVFSHVPFTVMSLSDDYAVIDSNLLKHSCYPAISVEKSVSRLFNANLFLNKIANQVKKDLFQYNMYIKFSYFASDVIDSNIVEAIKTGEMWNAILNQEPSKILSYELQFIILYSVNEHYLDYIPTDKIGLFIKEICKDSLVTIGIVMSNIRNNKKLSKTDEVQLKVFVSEFVNKFIRINNIHLDNH